ncbi:MAG: CooT family nickel-binding protein [Candidatus Adiutrix sp.]
MLKAVYSAAFRRVREDVMCEANVYFKSHNDADYELLMESVDEIIPEGAGFWRLKSIFGEQKVVEGHIVSMNLVNHRIVFAPKNV